ncbi:MAG: hypothetical protein ACE5PO_08215 [Candidatus Bathyarchaeia archaeon]
MPKRIKDAEEFQKLTERATECRVKRLGERVKLKLRTANHLYTLVVPEADVAALLKKINLPIQEF